MSRLQGVNGAPLLPGVNVMAAYMDRACKAHELLMHDQITDPKKHFQPRIVAEQAFDFAAAFCDELKLRMENPHGKKAE